ncbi:MAG: hypothetical protein K6F99_09160 [Lachnospiraceae bacterium]|nr:hypothetical protein [Lachnospiraceae bacterium]
MILAAQSILLIIVNLIIYFVFGSIITQRFKGDNSSISLNIVLGFFFMFVVFDIFCFPVMLKWRPLSLLSHIWVGVLAVVFLLALILNRKYYLSLYRSFSERFSKNRLFYSLIIILVILQILIITGAYYFTLDASYYVAAVTTDVTTDTISIYDPFTGDWLDHFEFRYFFATYTTNNAVMCYLFKIPPVTYMKISMTAVSLILSNLCFYMTGRKLFGKSDNKVAVLMFFSVIMNFFFSSIYTPAEFLVTRSYEGKAMLGNIVLPMIFYLAVCVYEDSKSLSAYIWLFIVVIGATALSNSANMLLPVMIFVMFTPLIILKKDIRIFAGALISVIPGFILSLMYVAYVKGLFVIYTYPR